MRSKFASGSPELGAKPKEVKLASVKCSAMGTCAGCAESKLGTLRSPCVALLDEPEHVLVEGRLKVWTPTREGTSIFLQSMVIATDAEFGMIMQRTGGIKVGSDCVVRNEGER